MKSELEKVEKISEYVFTNPETLQPYKDLKDRFTYIVKKLNITDLVFHDLRHTAATRMVESGTDLICVKEALGHSDINMTMRYAHPVPEMMLKAIMSLNNMSFLHQ
ncbi:MAG: tyrosine-type recombinase/integrase [Candidatus Gastranaerophilaceae bacterium]